MAEHVDVDHNDDWSGQSAYWEYSKAANPVGAGRVPKIPMQTFAAKQHQDLRTGIVHFDLSTELAIDHGPATSPALLASFVRIAANEHLITSPRATSELYYVMEGEGVTTLNNANGDQYLQWQQGDFFVLPANCVSTHTAKTDSTMYWVTDEPLLRYLGVQPSEHKFAPTRFPRQVVTAHLDEIENAPHALDRNRLSVLLNTTPNDRTQTVTHTLWAMYGLVPEGAVQRAHRHQSVALDLVADCQPGCYTLVGRSVNEHGEIVDPVRVDWEPHSAFVTPPGLWHAHYNESGHRAYIIPIQDAGLHTYLRSLDIRFVGPR